MTNINVPTITANGQGFNVSILNYIVLVDTVNCAVVHDMQPYESQKWSIFIVTKISQVFGAHGGGDNTGGSVSTAGDFNGDGYADLIIGSSAIRTVYVIFGPDTNDVDLLTISGSGRGFQV